MIYYSMQLHAKSLEELTKLNIEVDSFDEKKYIETKKTVYKQVVNLILRK